MLDRSNEGGTCDGTIDLRLRWDGTVHVASYLACIVSRGAATQEQVVT